MMFTQVERKILSIIDRMLEETDKLLCFKCDKGYSKVTLSEIFLETELEFRSIDAIKYISKLVVEIFLLYICEAVTLMIVKS